MEIVENAGNKLVDIIILFFEIKNKATKPAAFTIYDVRIMI